ncbi:MAG: DUF2461 domain-containing protein [Clostridia bacterium]|nr:DUF2461 domain-containing protein [Clostridia bacterium]
MFNGFTDKTFEFFMAIRFNNNREFFQDNHDWYLESVRTPALELVEALSESVEALDPELERRPHKVVSRINRDIRFSNDKSPYRDYLWLAFRKPGEERKTTLGVYADFSDAGLSYGMGFYSENLPLMKAHRNQLLNDFSEFQEIAERVEERFTLFSKSFRRMKIPEHLPEALHKWYPLRGFYVEKEINDFDLLKSSKLADEIADGYRYLQPLYRYFTRLTPVED